MASRQEQKEKARQERMELERKEATAAARRKRLQMVFGGLLGLGVLAAVVLLVAGALGGDDSPSAQTNTSENKDLPTLPAQTENDFNKAAEKAGCELIHPPSEGAGHEEREFTADDYKTNPPTSGTHFPRWYDDGVYEPGTVPDLGQLVHTLEHGRINVQYKPGTPEDVVLKLEAFVAENDGYHMLLYENTTEMEYEVAATAWLHLLGCPEYNDSVPDALRTFRQRYIDKGPEQVP